MPINVLLVDDSAVIRGLMSRAVDADPDIHVVGTASDGSVAVNLVKTTKPDVVVLDIEMPVMDGLTALPLILQAAPGCKIIMASTLTSRNASISMQALALGASDYLPKPSSKFGDEVDVFYRELIAKIKALGGAALQPASLPAAVKLAPVEAKPVVLAGNPNTPLHVSGVHALAIASSTGGPQALLSFFGQIKGRLPNLPIFITQHMPPTFTTILAEHIAQASGRPATEGKEGLKVEAGHVYVAPGDFHMVPQKQGNDVIIHVNKDPQENYCRPAADPMLRALSRIYGKHLLVVVLTGMGQDGMLGAKEVIAAGGSVVAQDEASCVVYGMPKAVVENGLCRAVLPLSEMGRYLLQQIEGRA